METYRAIAIGINRYQFFEPLSHGEVGACSLYQFWRQEGRIETSQCLLLTDNSPPVAGRSTAPTRDSLLSWLRCPPWDRGHPSEFLWFFFRGYGVTYQGKDYLVPIDGNLFDIANTGIGLDCLFPLLRQQGAARVLALFDLNCPPVGRAFGRQAVALARESGIALALSCQVEAPNQGQFANALLEALGYYRQRLTLAKLEAYLGERLAELAIEIVSPSLTVSHQPLLPQPERQRLQWMRIPPPAGAIRAVATLGTGELERGNQTSSPFKPSGRNLCLETDPSQRVPGPERDSSVTAGQPPLPQPDLFLRAFWEKIRDCKGILFSLVLILTFIIFLPHFYRLIQLPQARTQADSRARLNRARTYLQTHQASEFNRAIGEAGQIQPGEPLYPEAQAEIGRWSQVILDIARGRAAAEDFAGAIAAAELVPGESAGLQALSQKLIQQWRALARRQRENQALLEAVRASIDPSQASSYHRAIGVLGRLQPGEPGYSEARQLATAWSQEIYAIASSRAAGGNFRQAIEAAELVPAGTPTYQRARRAIAQWQRQVK